MFVKALLAIGCLIFAVLLVLSISATQTAGKCPHCAVPTFYIPGRVAHSCPLCNRIYRLGECGESRMAKRK